MNNKMFIGSVTVSAIFFMSGVFLPSQATAHCDGMDGPVVQAAQKALQAGNVNMVLLWVQKKNESEIQQAFQKTLAVRKLGGEARDLADRYFFETLVRIHRAGEGAPYTGLKPAGRDLGPAIPAADKAIESGRTEPLLKLLQDSVQEGLRRHFHSVLTTKEFEVNDVGRGRKYVDSYVRFVHYVEHVYESASMSTEGHYPESKEAGSQN